MAPGRLPRPLTLHVLLQLLRDEAGQSLAGKSEHPLDFVPELVVFVSNLEGLVFGHLCSMRLLVELRAVAGFGQGENAWTCWRMSKR